MSRLSGILSPVSEYDFYGDNMHELMEKGIIRLRVHDDMDREFRKAAFYLLQHGFQMTASRLRPLGGRFVEEYDFTFVPDGSEDDPVHFAVMNSHKGIYAYELGHSRIEFPKDGLVHQNSPVFEESEWQRVAIVTCQEPKYKTEFRKLLEDDPEVVFPNSLIRGLQIATDYENRISVNIYQLQG